MPEGWTPLTEPLDCDLWRAFEAKFSFVTGGWLNAELGCKSQLPGIKEPIPSITYNIDSVYSTLRSNTGNLHEMTVLAFRECTPGDGIIYALDWQHKGREFRPHFAEIEHTIGSPSGSIFPDGDYIVFLSPDMSFGTFGHPWECTLCIFGEELIESFRRHRPSILDRPLRVDGKTVAMARPELSPATLVRVFIPFIGVATEKSIWALQSNIDCRRLELGESAFYAPIWVGDGYVVDIGAPDHAGAEAVSIISDEIDRTWLPDQSNVLYVAD